LLSAIELTATGTNVTIFARQNIFTAGVNPSTIAFDASHGAGFSGMLDVSSALSTQRSFVQTLYNQMLGRTGAISELDPWVQVLNTQGQSAVVQGIAKSSEALTRVVDGLYLRFLGRAALIGEESGWIAYLQGGGTLEAVENAFLTSQEYINHINTDYVQSLYINVLGRTGSPAELAQWHNNLQSLGFAAVANAFTHSGEYRLDTLRSYFQTFIHRTPSDAELTPLVNSTSDLFTLSEVVLSSTEFFNNG
jgi:hypothetical protein